MSVRKASTVFASAQANRIDAILAAGICKETDVALADLKLSDSTNVGLMDIMDNPDLKERVRSFNPYYERFVHDVAPTIIAKNTILSDASNYKPVLIQHTLLSDVAEHSPEWDARAKMIELSYDQNPGVMALGEFRINVYALKDLLPFLMELEGLAAQVRVTADDAVWDDFGYANKELANRSEALADIMVARMEGSAVPYLYKVVDTQIQSVHRSGRKLDLSKYEKANKPDVRWMTSLPEGIVVDTEYLQIDSNNPNGIEMFASRTTGTLMRSFRLKKYTGDTFSRTQSVSAASDRTDWLLGLMNQSRIRSGTFACAFAAFVETSSRQDMTRLNKFELEKPVAPLDLDESLEEF